MSVPSASAPPSPCCKVCGEPVTGSADVACGRCHAPHHADCWSFTRSCAIFGCGGTSPVDLASVQGSLRPGALTITETSEAPRRLAPLFLGLARHVRSEAVQIPPAIAAGVAGSLVGAAAMMLAGAHGIYYQIGILLGLFYGLVAPFVIPHLERRPLATTGACLGTFLGIQLLLAWTHQHFARYLHDPGILLAALFLGSVLLAVSLPALQSAALAEGLLGPRSLRGSRLGRLALPARFLITKTGVALTVGLYVAWEGKWPRGVSGEDLLRLGVIGFAAASIAVPALEVGRAEHLKALFAAEAEERTALSASRPGTARLPASSATGALTSLLLLGTAGYFSISLPFPEFYRVDVLFLGCVMAGLAVRATRALRRRGELAGLPLQLGLALGAPTLVAVVLWSPRRFGSGGWWEQGVLPWSLFTAAAVVAGVALVGALELGPVTLLGLTSLAALPEAQVTEEELPPLPHSATRARLPRR